MDICTISASEARPIHKDALRPCRPESEVIYPFDDSASTTHLGAFDGDRLIGVASFFAEACPASDVPHAWRLPGMAVVAGHVELTVEADNPRAISFYQKLGFELEGTLRSAYKRSHQAHCVDELFMAKLLPPLSELAR